MKKMIMLACVTVAALMMSGGTATAGGCAYGGGFGGVSRGFGPSAGFGYSRFTPRSSFSVGYSSFPSYRTRFRSRSNFGVYSRGIGYGAPVYGGRRGLGYYGY